MRKGARLLEDRRVYDEEYKDEKEKEKIGSAPWAKQVRRTIRRMGGGREEESHTQWTKTELLVTKEPIVRGIWRTP